MRDMRDMTSAPGLSPSECSLSVLNLPPYRLAALSQVSRGGLCNYCIFMTC